MALKVKKNKTPKASKAKKSKPTMLQKQQVSQNVKVNIYKPSRVPKDYKVKQLGRDGAGGAVPNVRELPSSSFQIVNNQPRPLLYNELFGNARPLSVSPFERLLASQAVEDNRQAQVGELRNSLENSRLKAIQRQPILAPARRAESEQDRFTARATASMEDNRRPFSVTSVDEQGTLGASLKARIPQVDYIRQARLEALRTPAKIAVLRSQPSSIVNILHDAEDEGLSGERQLPRGESSTFRTDPEPLGGEPQFLKATGEEELQADGIAALGVPDIPNRLISYAQEHGTSGDLLEDQRGEVVPVSQGAVEAENYQPATPVRRGPGAPIRFDDTPHRRGREYMREYRKVLRAKSNDK